MRNLEPDRLTLAIGSSTHTAWRPQTQPARCHLSAGFSGLISVSASFGHLQLIDVIYDLST